MAKDVDLSSQGWTDLIFEGKNKEFGAYQLRRTSGSRHNKSVFIVMVVLAIVLSAVILIASGVIKLESEEDAGVGVEQEVVLDQMNETEEEEFEEMEDIEIPDKEEVELLPVEEVAAEQLVTELKLVDEPEEDKEIKDISEVMENDAEIGTQNVEGVADLNKTNVEDKIIVEEKPVEAPKVEPVFNVVEQPASYPGGEAELLKWIGQNIQYPPMAAEEGAQGRVVVQFVVEKDGRVGQVKVVRGRHPELDKEAVRVVKSIKTRFVPGKNNGQPVRQWFTLPINFKLQQ